MSRKGWALFICMCVIWGLPYLFIRVAVRELSPASLVLYRTTPAAILLLPLALRQGRLGELVRRWRWLLVYTAVELAVPWLLLARAEQHISSSLAGLLVATVPLVGAVLYRVLGVGDRLDARRLIGLLIGFAGVAALVGIDVGGSDLAAIGEVLIVAVCYASGALIIGRKLAGLPSFGVVAASLLLTAVVYAPAGVAQAPWSLSGETIAALAVLAVVCTAVAFTVFFALIAEVGPSRATVFTYINPLVAVLLGVVLLGEPFTVGIAVGMPLILAGSVLGTAPALRRADGARPPGDTAGGLPPGS